MELHARSVRQDVRELGTLLGTVLEAQTSTDAFETVERLRTGAIDYRRGDAADRDALRTELRALGENRQDVVARAFTAYFELINLAEERERVRAIREGSQAGTLADSVEAAIEALADDGADPETIEQVFADVLIEPTFTAHPTEARRKTVKAKLRSIARALEELDERRLTDLEGEQQWREVNAEVTSLWQTAQIRRRRPHPLDEARNVQWYLENTLFDVTGDVYDELERVVEKSYGRNIDVPKLFEFRSWAGSDRDGNPFVTPEVTDETLERQREVILARYIDALGRLSGVLSQDESRIEVGATLTERIEATAELLPVVASAAADRYPEEPLRQHLALMRERVDRVGDIRPGGYDDADGLREDLQALATSLVENDAQSIVDAHVEPLIRRVETFGFHLASLDLRDHRENHTTAVDEALAREGIDYHSLDEDERVELLTDAILQDDSIIDAEDRTGLSDTASKVLERFSRLADWQREYGADAIDTYCISMTDGASHVLEVLFLADQVGVVTLPDHSGLDVVPLLETESALSGARRIMGTLFENEAYGAALEARGGLQEIMLGYSDSNKENGFLAANWSLYRNQKRLATIADEYDVELRLFHGRGGSISRGGGPMNRALLALPPETVSGQVKFTEQGEAIAEKYANPRVAERNIEQMLDAQLRARYDALVNPHDEVPGEWIDAMDEMADTARSAYRDLLESEGFVPYFERATPIEVIEELNLGSRPASRSGSRTVEDLRAIPWVFSWTQSRSILPGWYALGTGVNAYLQEDGDPALLQEMYDDWPYFRTIVDNAALALATTDLEIAAEYAHLAPDDLRERFFPRIEAEYERSVEAVETITDHDELPMRDWLAESLARRNPYVDPLNLLQVQLLSLDERSEAQERSLRLTVKGIAAGMKNTG